MNELINNNQSSTHGVNNHEPKEKEIHVSCVVEVLEINDAEEKFEIHGELNFRMHLDYNKTHEELSYDELKHLNLHYLIPFHPGDSFFCNSSECHWDFDETEFEIRDHILIGHIEYCATLVDFLDLHDFPFDRQNLNISFKMVGFEKDQALKIMLYGDKIRVHIAAAAILNEWTIEPVIEQFGIQRHEKHCGPTSLEIRFRLQRIPKFYIYQIIIPLFLIVSLGFLSSTINFVDIADRLSIILTLLLTAVAFKYMVAEYLPRVPYVTILDKYVTTGFVMLFISATEIGLMKFIHNHGGDSYSESLTFIDQCFWAILYVSFLIPHLIWFSSGCSDKPFRSSWEKLCELDDEADIIIQKATSSVITKKYVEIHDYCHLSQKIKENVSNKKDL